MTIPSESVEVGKCYLGDNGQARRVVRLWPDGRVQYETRARYRPNATTWKPGMLSGLAFAVTALREVPCDWTPDTDLL
jgi:hypothetical protein